MTAQTTRKSDRHTRNLIRQALKKFTASKRSPGFRFLELPPELRSRIYAFLTYDENALILRRLKPPAITRAAKQLRLESIPVFLDVNTFIAQVIVPYTRHAISSSRWYQSQAQGAGSFLDETDPRLSKTGRLQLPREIHAWFRDAGKAAARIKNLDFQLYDLRTLNDKDPLWGRKGVTVSLRLGKQPVVRIEQQYRVLQADQQRYGEDWEYIWSEMVELMKEHISKPGYGGLMISDV